MEHDNWFDAAIDFAIEREIEAREFYLDLAQKMDNPAMADVFKQFAAEEFGHKEKLEAVKTGKIQVNRATKVQTLEIADYVVNVEPKAEMTYPEALILAMKKEKAAYKLYSDLAYLSDSGEQEDLFLSMAAEEAKHKLRFEIEYDDVVLKED